MTKSRLKVHLKICWGHGEKSSTRAQSQFPYPKKARTWHFAQSNQGAMLHLPPPIQRSLQRPDSEGVPSAIESWLPEPWGWEGGRRNGGSKRVKLYLFQESDFPPRLGVPTHAQDPTPPPYRTAQSSPSISPSVPRRLSDRAPERKRVAPPPAVSLRPTRPPTRRRQGLLNPPAEGCRAGPPRLLPGLPARRAGAPSAVQRGDSATDRKKRQAGSKGSALPTSGRKQPERGASRLSQPSTRRRHRSGDIKQEDGAKDHRIHERPRHHRKSAQAVVQGSPVERRKTDQLRLKVRLLFKAWINKPRS